MFLLRNDFSGAAAFGGKEEKISATRAGAFNNLDASALA